jgi:hypothetical protein
MALTNQYMEAAFGSAFTGLATVGYALKNNAGGDVVARTTSGVFEQADGTYGAIVPSIPDAAVTIEWDTGGASPVYAHESLTRVLDLEFMEAIEGGRQEITNDGGGTLTCYAADNVTVVATFLLYDSNGVRTTGLNQFGDASRPVAERVRA